MTEREALKLALEWIKSAPHGDNCFLHDDGEYNRCFCGKDSLIDHLQSVVEKLDEALAQPEPVAWGMPSAEGGFIVDCITPEEHDRVEGGYTVPLYTTPPQRKCKGIPRKGCSYLADCNSVCNKCGEIHHHHQMVWNHDHPTPPQRTWVGLDADEVFELASGRWTLGQMAVLVEAKLKEKNT